MRAVIVLLLVLLGGLQYRLWVGDGSLAEIWYLKQQLLARQEQNAAQRARNRQLEAEVQDLKQGLGAIEARARRELGMIRKDETFYMIVQGHDGG